MPGAAGLDFIEVRGCPYQFEIGRSKKCVFLGSKRHHFLFRVLPSASYDTASSQTISGCGAGVMRMQLSS